MNEIEKMNFYKGLMEKLIDSYKEYISANEIEEANKRAENYNSWREIAKEEGLVPSKENLPNYLEKITK